MPLSANTYKGLGLPRHGNALLEGVSTADVLTLQHSTQDEGNFLVFRDSPASSLFPESTVDTLDVLRFTSGGGLVGSPNSTLGWSISSAGLFSGYKRPVTTVSSATNATTIFLLASSQSGHLIKVDGGAQGLSVILPDAVAGLEYTIYQSSGHPAVITVVCSSDDTDDIILGGSGANSTLATSVAAAAPQTTHEGAMATFTAIDSGRWICVPALASSGLTSAVGETQGGWVVGTTVSVA